MDLLLLWEEFIKLLNSEKYIVKAYYKKITGIPFLYIKVEDSFDQKKLENAIRIRAAQVMKGKRLHSETTFVRADHSFYVYRHRFFVPQEKMFCCGNLCVDCIRLKKG